MFYRAFRIALAVMLAIGGPVQAQTGAGDGASGGYGGGYGGGGGATAGLSSTTTRAVTRTIKREINYCRRLDTVYRYDCYRQAYIVASRHMNGNPAYAEAQKALDGVVASLDGIVKRNADPAAPRAQRNLQTFTPIKPAAAPQAKKEFVKALDEAETILLRSADKGNVHFARIAEAVNSNKVLMRSRLQPGLTGRPETAFA